MFGLFVQNGPYYITKDGQLKLRSVPWTSRFSVLYVDNPVGTGYSFTDDKKGYARNETDVGRDLLEALLQFFTLFYEYAGNDFYVTGESYAGVYLFLLYQYCILHKLYSNLVLDNFFNAPCAYCPSWFLAFQYRRIQ